MSKGYQFCSTPNTYRGLATALLCALSGLAAAASRGVSVEDQVIREVYDAHLSGALAPTCDDVSWQGHAATEDPSAAEATFRRALDLGVVARRDYYMGLVALAKAGADFDRISSECRARLPSRSDEEIRSNPQADGMLPSIQRQGQGQDSPWIHPIVM